MEHAGAALVERAEDVEVGDGELVAALEVARGHHDHGVADQDGGHVGHARVVHERRQDPQPAAPAARHVFVVFPGHVRVAERVALHHAAQARDFVAVERGVVPRRGLRFPAWVVNPKQADGWNRKLLAASAA